MLKEVALKKKFAFHSIRFHMEVFNGNASLIENLSKVKKNNSKFIMQDMKIHSI